MAKAPTTETIAAELTVPERVLLFCLASDTNWVKTGASHATAQHLLVGNLVERDHATDFALTDQGAAPPTRRTAPVQPWSGPSVNGWQHPRLDGGRGRVRVL
jgi:hypothetical protein